MQLDMKDGVIHGLITNNTVIPLKKTIKLSEASRFEEAFKFLEDYIDFSGIGTEPQIRANKDEEFAWTKDELVSFLDQTDSTKQRIFLKGLAKSSDRLTWNDVSELMKQNGLILESFSMAGILSCFARRSKHFGKKEDFWVSDWDPMTEERFYFLKKPYQQIFKDYFKI